MNISNSTSYKMSRVKGKSSGWAAFDLKQKQKQGLVPDITEDPFPPVSSTLASLPHPDEITQNDDPRSFSIVVLPSKNTQALRKNGKFHEKFADVASCRTQKYEDTTSKRISSAVAIKKLKQGHCWAGESLLEDILATVDNNIEKASSILDEMGCTENFQMHKKSAFTELMYNSSVPLDENTDTNLSTEDAMDLTNLNINTAGSIKEKDKQFVDRSNSSVDNLPSASNIKLNKLMFNSIPVEPEWEFDEDVYSIHRKDALRMIRSAAHHSRAATNAFQRGDHASAQQHSVKAQDARLAAERLNADAAKKILAIRNNNNDLWTLDLHGLHASEAVVALQQHLYQMEKLVFSNCPVQLNAIKEKDKIRHLLLVGSSSCKETDQLDKQQESSRLRSPWLDVITGVGNHSRGQAALPISVRSFLNENGYRHDELRPGVIRVWPKFR